MGYEAPVIDVLALRAADIVCLSYGNPGDAGTIGDEDPGHSHSF